MKTDYWSRPASYYPAFPLYRYVLSRKTRNVRWEVKRLLAGDDYVLECVQAKAAAANQSGSGLRFAGDGPSIQRVRLYRYR